MRLSFLTFFFWLILGNLDQAHSVFIKSELDEHDQRVQCVKVCFAEGNISKDNIEEIFGEVFTNETTKDKGIYKNGVSNHNYGLYEQINQDRLSEELKYIIGYSTPCLNYLENVKHVNFSFRNISTKTQLSLLSNFMEQVISILSDIENDHYTRVKEIEISYAYWNESPSRVNQLFNHTRVGWTDGAEPKKAKFEEKITDFKERKKKIRAKNK